MCRSTCKGGSRNTTADLGSKQISTFAGKHPLLSKSAVVSYAFHQANW